MNEKENTLEEKTFGHIIDYVASEAIKRSNTLLLEISEARADQRHKDWIRQTDRVYEINSKLLDSTNTQNELLERLIALLENKG